MKPVDLRGMGVLHGCMIEPTISIELGKRKRGRDNIVHAKVQRHLATFAAVTLAWVFFRAEQLVPLLR